MLTKIAAGDLFLPLVLAMNVLAVQAAPVTAPATSADQRHPPQRTLRLFLDCQDDSCDQEFARRTLIHVEFVRDRDAADLHVLVTFQRTAAGGREYQMQLLGRGTFSGSALVLKVTTDADSTDDVTRNRLMRLLSAGLAPFLAQANGAEAVVVSVEQTSGVPPGQAADDPWNQWVFNLGANGLYLGEQTLTLRTLDLFASANRVTEQWKFNNILSVSNNSNRFEVPGADDVTSSRSSVAFDTLVGRSIDEHWSIGGVATISHSSFLNQDLFARIGPILEFNVFPYSESSTRQFTVQLGTGLRAYDYVGETIFQETAETFWDVTLETALTLRKPWGSVSAGADVAAFVRDWDKNRTTGSANIDLRITQGLSFRLGGQVSSIHDQVFLPRQGATLEEILLRQRQLRTSYSYTATFGINYTFGSIFNSIVNPRFVGAGGAGY